MFFVIAPPITRKVIEAVTRKVIEQDQKRKPNELKPGDHVYAWRSSGLAFFAHHGIYIGDDKVIHFTSDSSSSSSSSSSSKHGVKCVRCQEIQKDMQLKQNNEVKLICINCFLGPDKLYVFRYSVPKDSKASLRHGGTYSMDDSNPPNEVIDRAKYLLREGFGSYDLIMNNCETFAQYCKTGLVNLDGQPSGQVKTVRSDYFIPTALLPILQKLDAGRKIKVPVKDLRGRSPAEYARNYMS